jgi:hypothetical protein
MIEALCIGGPLDGKIEKVVASANLFAHEPQAFSVGERFPDVAIQMPLKVSHYRLECFRSLGHEKERKEVLFWILDDLSIHEALLKLIEGYKP